MAQIGNGMPQVPLLRPGSDAGATAKPQTRLYGSKILPQSRVDPRLIPLLLRLKPRNAIRIQPRCSNSGPPESVICPGAASPRETPRSNPQSERYVPQPIPKNPNSLQQGTNTHNSTQLQLLHRKRLTTNPITPIPTYPNLFHVAQSGHPSSLGRRESSPKKLNQRPPPLRRITLVRRILESELGDGRLGGIPRLSNAPPSRGMNSKKQPRKCGANARLIVPNRHSKMIVSSTFNWG